MDLGRRLWPRHRGWGVARAALVYLILRCWGESCRSTTKFYMMLAYGIGTFDNPLESEGERER